MSDPLDYIDDGSRATGAVLSRAARMRQKLQSSLEASAIDIEDVPYQHAGHTAVKDNANETHFNIRVISPKFEGQSLVKRHRMDRTTDLQFTRLTLYH
uniref:Uncharacterized protein n=1 Tax=Oryza barthii TaxID=65489 RepID=A0A0D3F804_9ORYZ